MIKNSAPEFFVVACCASLIFASGCGSIPTSVVPVETGSIVVRVYERNNRINEPRIANELKLNGVGVESELVYSNYHLIRQVPVGIHDLTAIHKTDSVTITRVVVTSDSVSLVPVFLSQYGPKPWERAARIPDAHPLEFSGTIEGQLRNWTMCNKPAQVILSSFASYETDVTGYFKIENVIPGEHTIRFLHSCPFENYSSVAMLLGLVVYPDTTRYINPTMCVGLRKLEPCEAVEWSDSSHTLQNYLQK